MLDEKIDKATIDAAAEKFGMPMGPIELADQVGLDTCLRSATCCEPNSATLLPPGATVVAEKVTAGELGRKTGKGFYAWKDGKAQKSAARSQPSPPNAR